MSLHTITETARGLVRPLLTYSGWAILLAVVYKLISWFMGQLASVQLDSGYVAAILAGVISTFTTAVVAIVSFWFGQRRPHNEQH